MAVRDGRRTGEAPLFPGRGGGVHIALVHVATGGSEVRGRPGVVAGCRRRRGGNSPASPLAFPAGGACVGDPVASSRRRSRGRASPRRRLSSTERIRGGIFSAIIAK